MHIPTSDRINWALGLRGLLVALTLAGVSSASGSQLPMLAAVLVAGWAVVKPLRFGKWALSPATLRFSGLLAVRIALLLAAAFALSFAVNSPEAALNVPGTLLFMALIGVVAVMAVRYAWIRTMRLAPRAWASSVEAAGVARGQAAAVWGAMRQG